MERRKRRKDAIKQFFDSLKNKDVPQDVFSNSMTTTSKPFSILWRPNNYRRQIEVKTKTNSTIQKIRTTIHLCSYSTHTKLISCGNYQGITIQYGRNTLTGIWSQPIIDGNKETFFIKADSIEELENRLIKRRDEIKEHIDKALNSFARKFNIDYPLLRPKWSRHEDWIKGDDFIDSLPESCIIHDTVFKKVYGQGIEFIGGKGDIPATKIKNYIKNRAIEDIAPELAAAMNNMVSDFREQALKPLTAEITTHLKRLRQEIRDFNRKKRRKKRKHKEDLRRFL